MLAHTYSETTLTLGQRLGYLALTPGVPQPEAMRTALFHVLISSGLAMPDAVMQYALPDIDGLCIDVAAIQRRRDRMVAELQKQGYQLHVPQATFYLLPQAPRGDDRAFCALLAHQSVACSRVTSSNCPAISASPSQLPTTWSKKRSPFSLTRFSAPTRPCPPDPHNQTGQGNAVNHFMRRSTPITADDSVPRRRRARPGGSWVKTGLSTPQQTWSDKTTSRRTGRRPSE